MSGEYVTSIPHCCTAEFIDYMMGGLKYNDVNVQLASVYTCVQLYSRGPADHSSQLVHNHRVTQKLVHDLLHVLEQTNHAGLISSLVGQCNCKSVTIRMTFITLPLLSDSIAFNRYSFSFYAVLS